jgi:hypothetical protein
MRRIPMIPFFVGLMCGGSLGLLIATLMISSGRASEEERTHDSYKAGLLAGRGSTR